MARAKHLWVLAEGGRLEIERKLEVGKDTWVPRARSQILLWAIGRFLGGKIQW